MRRMLHVLAGVALVATVLFAASGVADAAVINVTTTADGGAGSLREAFTTAQGNAQDNEIVLAAGETYELTNCQLGQLQYSAGFVLTITGNGATIEQTCRDRVIEIDDSDLVITDLTITGGDKDGNGGGIDHDDSGDLTITRSSIVGNKASGSGGGINADNGGLMTITDSTISGNSTGDGDGGAINSDDKVITITASTLSGNSAQGDGGAIDSEDGDVTFTNSTVSGNTSTQRAALWQDDSVLTLVNTTVVGNTGPSFANIEADDELVTTASVIAGPLGGGMNCSTEETTSNGYNFSDDATCGLDAPTDTENGGDPQAGALADNGGPTETHLPAASSPLVNQIPAADCAVNVDQRGISRPQEGACEIGSVEREAPVEPTTTVAPTTTTAAPTTTAAAQPQALTPTFTG